MESLWTKASARYDSPVTNPKSQLGNSQDLGSGPLFTGEYEHTDKFGAGEACGTDDVAVSKVRHTALRIARTASSVANGVGKRNNFRFLLRISRHVVRKVARNQLRSGWCNREGARLGRRSLCVGTDGSVARKRHYA